MSSHAPDACPVFSEVPDPAEKPASGARAEPETSATVGEWLAFHLHYHGDLNRVLLNFVQPLVTSLWPRGHLESFFYLRYFIGGPHVRLRLRVRPGSEAEVEREVRDGAVEFLARWPSLLPCDEETIRRRNRTILGHDPHEQEDSVYPDNTLLAAPFRPETERYGGQELLHHSLDFFALSSVSALCFLAAHSGQPRGRHLALAFRLLARQLWGFAADEEEALAVIRAFVESRGLAPIVELGERAYGRRQSVFRDLLWTEIVSLVSGEPAGWESEANHCLSRVLAAADGATRCRIGCSQLHMTANRLGITNAEEAYLGCLMEMTSRDLANDPVRWNRLLNSLAERQRGSAVLPRDLVPQALERLVQVTPAAATTALNGGSEASSAAPSR